MRVNKIIATAVVASLLSLQAWTLKQVVDLKVRVAELGTQVSLLTSSNTKHLAQNER